MMISPESFDQHRALDSSRASVFVPGTAGNERRVAQAATRTAGATQQGGKMSATFTEALNGTNELTIGVTGRATGREFSMPVWFVAETGKVYLVPVHGSDSDWYRNVVAKPRLQLTADGATVSATATPIGDPARVQQVVERFRTKYGEQQIASYYPKTDAAVEVSVPE